MKKLILIFTMIFTAGVSAFAAKIKIESSDNDSSIQIKVRRGAKLIQSIEYEYPSECFEYAEPFEKKIEMEDLNFDGYDDIKIYLGSYGNQGVEYWQFFLWDSKKLQFIKDESFGQSVFDFIPNAKVNSKEKCIKGFSRASAAYHHYFIYEFQDGSFHLVRHLHELASCDIYKVYGLNVPDGEDCGEYALKHFGFSSEDYDKTFYIEEKFENKKHIIENPALIPPVQFKTAFGWE